MKLFVWHDVLTDYMSGVMFALAEDVDSARRLIYLNQYPADRDKPETEWYKSGAVWCDLATDPKVYDTPVGFAVWGGA